MSRQVDENYFLVDEDSKDEAWAPKPLYGSDPEFTAEVDKLQDLEDKNAWIQKAKALFFDLQFCTDALHGEIQEIIEEGGGYNPDIESSVTKLRWKK